MTTSSPADRRSSISGAKSVTWGELARSNQTRIRRIAYRRRVVDDALLGVDGDPGVSRAPRARPARALALPLADRRVRAARREGALPAGRARDPVGGGDAAR